MALDAVEVCRLLLLKLSGDETAERNRKAHEEAEGGALTLTEQEEADEEAERKKRGPRPERPERIAVFVGERLAPLLVAVGSLSAQHVAGDEDAPPLVASKEKMQRALASLLATLLSGTKVRTRTCCHAVISTVRTATYCGVPLRTATYRYALRRTALWHGMQVRPWSDRAEPHEAERMGSGGFGWVRGVARRSRIRLLARACARLLC